MTDLRGNPLLSNATQRFIHAPRIHLFNIPVENFHLLPNVNQPRASNPRCTGALCSNCGGGEME